MGVRVAFKEVELQRQIKLAGGTGNPWRRGWERRYDRAIDLGLEARIEKLKVSNTGHPKSV